ncbi:MAG: EthD family reductase [Spirochaetaceae bacterium]|nr:MAG: EthD family reductase [Spirochaetaceae bacterium]
MGIKLIALLKAKPGMSLEDLKRRWVDEHASFTLKFKNLKGYRINIASEEYQEIEGQLPFDGTAELWWDSIEEMKADFASPEAEAAVADARKFSSELIHIYTVEHIAR